MPADADTLLAAAHTSLVRATESLAQGTSEGMDGCAQAVLEAIGQLKQLPVGAGRRAAKTRETDPIALDLKTLNALLRQYSGWLQSRAERAGQTGLRYTRQGIASPLRRWPAEV